MERKEKINLLTSMMRGNKPDMPIYIIHTDFGLILDPDKNKKLRPGEEEEYIRNIQKENPLYNVVYINITKEEFRRFIDKMEQII